MYGTSRKSIYLAFGVTMLISGLVTAQTDAQQQLEKENTAIKTAYEGLANCAAFYMTSVEVLRQSMTASNANTMQPMIDGYSQGSTVMMTMAALGATAIYSKDEAARTAGNLISTTVERMKGSLWQGRTQMDSAFVSRYRDFVNTYKDTCQSLLSQSGKALQQSQQ